MIHTNSTVNPQEISKFAQHAPFWWDPEGPLKTLHDINPTRVDFIKQHSSLRSLTVLDVGCGGGILCEALARDGAIVTGVDAQADAISIAQRHAIDNQLQINYHCTAIEAYQNSQFDVITCMELLEHVDNPELIFEHCHRLLKPRGLLFVSTLSRTLNAYATAIIAAEYLLNLLPRQTHDYNKFIKPSELLAMARSWNFKLIAINGMDYNPFLRKASLGTNVCVNYLVALQSIE